jgi:histidine triad (HIT) family protein
VAACRYCEIFEGRAGGPPVALDTPELVSFMGRFQPTGPGYSLVVPRRHVQDLHALEEDDLRPTLAAVQRVSRAVVRAFGVSGTTVMQNNGRPGQRVMHLHFHVVPRWEGDGYPCESNVEVEHLELERQATLLRAHLGAGV